LRELDEPRAETGEAEDLAAGDLLVGRGPGIGAGAVVAPEGVAAGGVVDRRDPVDHPGLAAGDAEGDDVADGVGRLAADHDQVAGVERGEHGVAPDEDVLRPTAEGGWPCEHGPPAHDQQERHPPEEAGATSHEP
jgi:hypothetical protein